LILKTLSLPLTKKHSKETRYTQKTKYRRKTAWKKKKKYDSTEIAGKKEEKQQS
jgi:hypothetical protein